MAIQVLVGVAAKRAATRAALKKAKKYRELKGARAKVRARRKALGLSRGRETDAPYLLSPEGIAMMTAALFFDFVPPVIVLTLNIFFGLGELLSWPLDILATIMIGGWMWARGGKMTFGKKFMRFLKKRGLFIFLEYVPIVGSIGPWWTINVFMFLRK